TVIFSHFLTEPPIVRRRPRSLIITAGSRRRLLIVPAPCLAPASIALSSQARSRASDPEVASLALIWTQAARSPAKMMASPSSRTAAPRRRRAGRKTKSGNPQRAAASLVASSAADPRASSGRSSEAGRICRTKTPFAVSMNKVMRGSATGLHLQSRDVLLDPRAARNAGFGQIECNATDRERAVFVVKPDTSRSCGASLIRESRSRSSGAYFERDLVPSAVDGAVKPPRKNVRPREDVSRDVEIHLEGDLLARGDGPNPRAIQDLPMLNESETRRVSAAQSLRSGDVVDKCRTVCEPKRQETPVPKLDQIAHVFPAGDLRRGEDRCVEDRLWIYRSSRQLRDRLDEDA